MPRRRGRAASFNPAARFDPIVLEPVPAELEPNELRKVPTRFYTDTSKSILARNESPDVGFTYSLNAYRGCEHGCIYCYARPSHEYLGWSAGLDFETKILVKRSAPGLLSKALSAPSWEPQAVALSGITDPYQPVERRLQLSRGCLEVFLRHRNPVVIITKNGLVRRDVDLLKELAGLNLVRVMMSITTLNPELVSVMEPRTSRPADRLRTVETLASAGIPVGVMVAPVIPGLTDYEMPSIIRAAADRGARQANYVLLRLPGAVEPLFIHWLETELPHQARKVLGRLREMRGGRLTDSRFGRRMRGTGIWADTVAHLFRTACTKAGFDEPSKPLSTEAFRRFPAQPGLFE